MAGTLMVHTPGHWVATREQAAAVPLPERTQSYMPVGHIDLLDTIARAAHGFGWKLKREQLALARDGQQMFAVNDYEVPGLDHRDMSLAIGLRNSYDKSLNLGVLGGGNVWICSNQTFSGDWDRSFKHTPNVWDGFGAYVLNQLGKMTANFTKLTEITAEWKKLDLDTKDSDHMLVQCIRRGVLPASELPKVLREYDEPTVTAWEQEGRNVWRLFNAYTQVAKSFSPVLQVERVRQAHNTFAELVAA